MSERFSGERRADWRVRLAQYLSVVARAPVIYGQHDCALFAAGAVEAMTGQDPARAFRGRYTTLAGGLRVLRKAGYADHVDVVRQAFAPVAVHLAMPGDLAVFAAADGPSLGVVQGAAVYVLHPAGHLGLMPLGEAGEAFTV